ncbi:MAG: tRNA (guanosine(37)-N1)-methyltransferase TrmD [Gammaproteobacteria bacterium]|jgi:tRNA (guanine37-N1)-methyltransferase|nr:tRNA (guanosine(37)-N1)-methyltransferase TrmD [Gammaproteobacteria bacterium]MBT3868133.1 tRNA (guanosine(37)-N1)-methyltransferase TrmD [Gammaproteobacteria bacterium]MBT4378832.1 tRNA (guanosine(37)-N1)-methyltransferase TrmD [Gammaproteobacteria bacterium]MBT4618098.1 tRNA (guanosine(37)-N1)-methyltransferase TrmD [Gammaproteobacteria bacterium]MBT5196012.1 tRNA (guanosine(37)-N1)-methyltransferase TrmD [Gammaproteobacteria bacterium]
MWIGVVSLFPEMFKAVTDYGISRRAVENGLLALEVWNPREFTEDKHRTVDDKPYGGGPGMLMKVQPLKDAINAAKSKAQAQCPVIYLSPQGKPLEQADLASLAMLPEVILVAGRYEGIDERLIESAIDMEVSIGDFVASGGELPAMLLIDGVTRLLPGAVGDADSVEQDSFSNGLLDYPQYTRPETEDGLAVPEVLMSGDHGQIARWRKMQSLGRTYEKRPDLITARTLTEEEKQLLDEYLAKRET